MATPLLGTRPSRELLRAAAKADDVWPIPAGPLDDNTILDLLNFTLAGAREGFGPFLGVYLQQQGFDPARTGFAMSIAGIAGVLATVFCGALIDRIAAKRGAVVTAVALIALGAALVVATRSLWVVAAGQVVIGIADSAVAPLVAALTLGLVGQQRYPDRVARNEAFNHAGNAASAALAGVLGYLFGLATVAIAIAVMAVASTAVTAFIDPRHIDQAEARGGEASREPTWRVLFGNKRLLLLAGAVFLLQTANGAMLPFLAQALTKQGHDPSLTTGGMTVASQASMVAASLVVPRLARGRGHEGIFAAALALVALRAGLAAWSGTWWSIGVVQIMEGLAMGLAGVVLPTLVAGLMSGSGHAGAGLGGVLTAYGAGAAVSPLVAGFVAQGFGFPAAFLGLGAIALCGFALWMARGFVPASRNPSGPEAGPREAG